MYGKNPFDKIPSNITEKHFHNRACAFEYKSSLVHLCSVSPPFLRKVYCFLVRNGTQKKVVLFLRIEVDILDIQGL